MKFSELHLGDRFDFIDPDSLRNTFGKTCYKTGRRTYRDEDGIRFTVGSVSTKVFHVVSAASLAHEGIRKSGAYGTPPHLTKEQAVINIKKLGEEMSQWHNGKERDKLVSALGKAIAAESKAADKWEHARDDARKRIPLHEKFLRCQSVRLAAERALAEFRKVHGA